MPRRRDLSPQEWINCYQAHQEGITELGEAVRRHREYLSTQADAAGSLRIGEDGSVHLPDSEEMNQWHRRLMLLEDQWLEATACLGHRHGLPNMYGRDGRPNKVPRTLWGTVPDEDIARVYAELKAAREAGDAERLTRALIAVHHIPNDVVQKGSESERVRFEATIRAEAEKYVRSAGKQSAYTWGRLESEYARWLGISVTSLQRHAGVRSRPSKH